jgi:hypothetical protein
MQFSVMYMKNCSTLFQALTEGPVLVEISSLFLLLPVGAVSFMLSGISGRISVKLFPRFLTVYSHVLAISRFCPVNI